MAASDVQQVSRGASPSVVGPYLAEHLGEPSWVHCTVELIAGGRSNLTYLVSSADGRLILRRPPLSTVLVTAHDMTREYTVMTALQDTDVPVPVTRLMCSDESVLGAPFYVMDEVDGHVIRDQLPSGYAETTAQREVMAHALVRVLATIHSDEILRRVAGFGRPEGYLSRQLRRWTRQWEACKAEPLPALDSLASGLAETQPDQSDAALVHGDYRLENVIMHPTDPSIVLAVLDWELSTLGDPLADVGFLIAYWGDARDSSAGLRQATNSLGFPTRAEIARGYAEVSGRDVSALPWYVAFAYFKLAVIRAGIAARYRAGAMVGDVTDTVSHTILPLVELGHDSLSQAVGNAHL